MLYSFPTTLTRKGKQTATVWIRNAGNVAATGLFTLRLYTSADNTTGTGAHLLGSAAKRTILQSGQRVALALTFTVPASMKVTSLMVALTFSGNMAERDPSNNYFFGAKSVTIK